MKTERKPKAGRWERGHFCPRVPTHFRTMAHGGGQECPRSFRAIGHGGGQEWSRSFRAMAHGGGQECPRSFHFGKH